MMKEFRELEFSKKLKKASEKRSKGYEDTLVKNGDMVYYQNQDKKVWLGPVKVFAVKGRDIFIFANGGIKKVPRCNIQLCEPEDDENAEEKEEKIKEDKKENSLVNFGDLPEELEDKEENRRVTRSMTEIERRDLERRNFEREQIATFWMKLENNECFDDISIYTVEVTVREHKTPEVIEAKQKDIENLEKYEVFEEVKYEG